MLDISEKLQEIARASAGAWYDVWFGELYREIRIECADEDCADRRALAIERAIRGSLCARPASTRMKWGHIHPDPVRLRLALCVVLANLDNTPPLSAIQGSSPCMTGSSYVELLSHVAFYIVRSQVEHLLLCSPLEVDRDLK